jgi:hypothetical protein
VIDLNGGINKAQFIAEDTLSPAIDRIGRASARPYNNVNDTFNQYDLTNIYKTATLPKHRSHPVP